jgi:tetratricopeptide (TPR) repeat protein
MLSISCSTKKTTSSKKEEEKKLIQTKLFFAKKYNFSHYDERILALAVKKKLISNNFKLCLEGEFDQAIENIRLESLKKNTLDHRLDLANCFFIKKEYTKALVFYSQVLSMTSDPRVESLVYNNLALSYANASFYQQAFNYFTKSLKLNPNNQLAAFNAALMKYKMGQFNQANKYMQKYFSKTQDPYVRQSQLLGLAVFFPNGLNTQEKGKINEKIYDGEFFVAVSKSLNLNTSQKLALFKNLKVKNLSSIAQTIVEEEIKKLSKLENYEKDRDNIYQRQRARSTANPK